MATRLEAPDSEESDHSLASRRHIGEIFSCNPSSRTSDRFMSIASAALRSAGANHLVPSTPGMRTHHRAPEQSMGPCCGLALTTASSVFNDRVHLQALLRAPERSGARRMMLDHSPEGSPSAPHGALWLRFALELPVCTAHRLRLAPADFISRVRVR